MDAEANLEQGDGRTETSALLSCASKIRLLIFANVCTNLLKIVKSS